MTLNNKMHGSEYNAKILEDSLKADYHFYFPNNSRTVVSDTTNASTKVAEYFFEYAQQVNCEIHQLNRAMQYGFGVLENKRLAITVYQNGICINLGNSKWKCVSDIVTPGGSFPQGKELMYNLTNVVTYFDHPQQFQQLKNVQE